MVKYKDIQLIALKSGHAMQAIPRFQQLYQINIFE